MILTVMVIGMTVLLSACSGSDEESTVTDASIPVVTEPTAASSEAYGSDTPQYGEGDIGEDAAKKIVLDRIEGATESNFIEFKREYDDGYLKYEGEVIYNGYEYEFEIDAATGNLLSWEVEQEYF